MADPMTAFKAGDRVRYIGPQEPYTFRPQPGCDGTVAYVGGHIRVVWDARILYGKPNECDTYPLPQHLELIV